MAESTAGNSNTPAAVPPSPQPANTLSPNARSRGDIRLRRLCLVLLLLTIFSTVAFIVTMDGVIQLKGAKSPNADAWHTNTGRMIVLAGLPPGLFCSAITAAAVMAVVGLFGLAIVLNRGRATTVIALLATIGGLLLIPVLLFAGVLIFSMAWTIQDERIFADGNTYYFMDTSFLQGQTMALGRLRSRYLFVRDMDILGSNNGDSPRSWASVIRPAGVNKQDYGQLYMNDSGLLAGMRTDCECYFAYDTKADRFYGHGDVEQLSPFILIGLATDMHQPDVDDLLRRESDRKGSENQPGLPRGKTLTDALQHPNPSVRDLARRILDIRKKREKTEGT